MELIDFLKLGGLGTCYPQENFSISETVSCGFWDQIFIVGEPIACTMLLL